VVLWVHLSSEIRGYKMSASGEHVIFGHFLQNGRNVSRWHSQNDPGKTWLFTMHWVWPVTEHWTNDTLRELQRTSLIGPIRYFTWQWLLTLKRRGSSFRFITGIRSAVCIYQKSQIYVSNTNEESIKFILRVT
jgi:hypothetical protein